MNRRRLLKLLTGGGFSGLAGCGSNTPPSTDSPAVVERSADRTDEEPITDSEKSETVTSEDTSGPEVSEFSVRPGPEAAQLSYNLVAMDERGIVAVLIESGKEGIQREFDNSAEIDIEGVIEANPGTNNSVQITVIDQSGNKVIESRSSYTRRYTRLDKLTTNVCCTYTLDGGNWGRKAGKPAIGTYDSAVSEASRHWDQLTGHGIRRLLIRFARDRDGSKVGRLLDSPLADDVLIQYEFDMVESLELGSLQSDLEALRRKIERLGLNHQATQDESPVITFRSIFAFGGDDDQSKALAERVQEDYGGFDKLQETVRTALTIDDREPFLVARLGMGISNPTNGSDEYLAWLESFDAVTHPLWLVGKGPDFLSVAGNVQEIYRNQWRWATEHGLDFVPVVFPGYDNRANHCWDTVSTHIQRDPELFSNALLVAAEYATAGRVTVMSFNDWFEGTQIEAGSKDKEYYGTSFLEAIKNLQQELPSKNDKSVHHVRPDGSDANAGSTEAPLRSIGHALFRARPGDTVNVHSGRYHEVVETVRGGTTADPITVTGPADAVFIGGDMTDVPEPMKIRHSHIYVTGLTFDGLQDPDNPDDVSSYAGGGIEVNPLGSRARFQRYLQNIKIKPHAIGNTRGAMIKTNFANNIEIGEFKVIGPGGVKHLKGDKVGHNGEVVYIGNPSTHFGGSGRSISGANVDNSHGYHVHHIDNSEGYTHAELVDVKAGAYDVTIEYCTDLGGAASYLLAGHPETSETAMSLEGNEITLRWSIVENSQGQAVEIGAWGAAHPQRFEEINGFPLPDPFFNSGHDNSVYGNRLLDNGGLAVQYPTVDGEISEEYGPDDQKHICGNEYNGGTHGNPGSTCPDPIPETDTIGHLGGDSPWK